MAATYFVRRKYFVFQIFASAILHYFKRIRCLGNIFHERFGGLARWSIVISADHTVLVVTYISLQHGLLNLLNEVKLVLLG